MGAEAKQTKLGQAGLLAMAFATPFALASGTGGYTHAQPVEATGNSIFVVGARRPTLEQIEKAQFEKFLSRLAKEYKLGINQIAQLMNVTRQTIHTWFGGKTEAVREHHKRRLFAIIAGFDKSIDSSLRPHMADLLRRKLDPAVSRFIQLASKEGASAEEIDSSLEVLNFKLSGFSRSYRLSETLKNKKPLV